LVELEKDILKKALGIFSSPDMKIRFHEHYATRFPVELMSGILGFSHGITPWEAFYEKSLKMAA
jgi:hypothetical protein